METFHEFCVTQVRRLSGTVNFPKGDEAATVAVKELVYKHLERTESDRAKEILSDWSRYQSKFWRIRPINVAPAPKPAIPAPAAAETIAKS